MMNNANYVVDVLLTGGQHSALGNGIGDFAYDESTGYNDITLGQGAQDAIVDASYGGHDDMTIGNGNFSEAIDYSALGGDVMTLGNGTDELAYDLSFAGGDTIRIGNGDGANAGDGGVTGGDTIILGSGNDDYAWSWGGGARDTISLGHGTGDVVHIGSGVFSYLYVTGVSVFDLTYYGEEHAVQGLATVTLPGLDATLDLSNVDTASFASPVTTQTSVSTTPLNIIYGLVAGDQIVLTSGVGNTDTLAGATATNLAGVAGEAVFATGTFNAASDTFTYSATGHDALLTFDGERGSNDFVSVVLVGAAHEIAGSSLSDGTLTLG